MKLVSISNKNIPQLSWCLKYTKGSEIIELKHGISVEVFDNSFFEGAWSDEINSLDFENNYFIGTGGKIKENKLLLSTPNHTLDRILIFNQKETIYASNSLPFLLSQTNQSLIKDYIFYDSILASIKYGLKRYIKEIPLAKGKLINVYYCSNIWFDDVGNITIMQKNIGPHFNCYSEIIRYIDNQIRRISSNSIDKNRSKIYKPITTISSGYDSAATAALVKHSNIDCGDAITFRGGRGGTNDSGEAIGKILNYNVKTFDRLAYLGRDDFPEAENAGGPTSFSSCDNELKGKLLFTGFHGLVWDRNIQDISNDIVRGDSGGASLTEMRLRTGFLHFPIPFLLSRSIPSVKQISKSEEMKPWTLFNSYDRPIPRRIIEESGVPRQMVGVKKRVSGVYVTQEGLENTLSQNSFNDFKQYLNNNWNSKAEKISKYYNTISRLRKINGSINKRIYARMNMKNNMNFKLPILLPNKSEILSFGYIGKHSLLFQWGIEKLIDRYRV